MNRRVQVILPGLLGAALALAGMLLLASAQRPSSAVAPARPKLIVVLVVDQMRADYVERFRARWHSGLRRLVDQGAWMTNAAYPYTATETCPGHATISSGDFPSRTGIVGNAWWDRQSSARVTCTEDAAARIVGMNRNGAGDSAARLETPSFAEQLRAAIAGSRTATMSAKARSAAMLAGHRADVAVWVDESTGSLLTSTAYAEALPDVARRFAEANPVARDASRIWQLSAPPGTYSGGRSDAGEGPPAGWTTSFPHPLSVGEERTNATFVARWRSSPFADIWLEHLAAATIDGMHLGAGNGIDFLGIGFSATDYIGHAFGPDSREIEDNFLALDRTIGELLATLDRSIGAGKYIVALSADHGVAPIPEQARLQGRDAGRANAGEIVAAIETVLAQELGEGRHVAHFLAPDLYFAPGVMARLNADPDLWNALRQAVLQKPGVAEFLRRGGPNARPNAQADARAAGSLSAALGSDTYPDRSGDVWIGLKPGWIFSGASGTTHGMPYDYDQRVPVILYGADIKPGRYDSPASPADIAPTLAAIAHIGIARTDGRVLTEALAPAPSPSR